MSDQNAPATVGHLRQFQNEFKNILSQHQLAIDNALMDVPTTAQYTEMRNEVLEARKDLKDLQKLVLEKHAQIANIEGLALKYIYGIIAILVPVTLYILQQLLPSISTSITPEHSSIETTSELHNYSIGVPEELRDYSDITIMLTSAGDGSCFFHYPYENEMELFAGSNDYKLTLSLAKRLKYDDKLHTFSFQASKKLDVFVHYGQFGDATFILPDDKCSTRYIVPELPNGQTRGKRFIMIYNLYEDTHVAVTLKSGPEMDTKRHELKYHLGRKEVITIPTDQAEILSDKPVCVYFGDLCIGTNFPCNGVITAVLPISQLSRSYIIPNVVNARSLVAIMSTADDNRVEINSRETLILDKTENNFTDFFGAEPMILESQNDIIVTALTAPYPNNSFLLWITSTDQYLSKYQFSVPYYDENFHYEIYVIYKYDSQEHLRLNKRPPYPITSSKRIIKYKGITYGCYRVRIQCCKDYIMEHKENEPFGLYVFGYSDISSTRRISFGYPAGISFK